MPLVLAFQKLGHSNLYFSNDSHFGYYASFTPSECESDFFFDVWCEQLHRKQCNPFVCDVAFAWCERTLSLSFKYVILVFNMPIFTHQWAHFRHQWTSHLRPGRKDPPTRDILIQMEPPWPTYYKSMLRFMLSESWAEKHVPSWGLRFQIPGSCNADEPPWPPYYTSTLRFLLSEFILQVTNLSFYVNCFKS